MDLNSIQNKKIIIRVDYNVPIKNRKISDLTRIRKSIPTLKTLLKNNNKITICSHLGRPNLDEDINSEYNQKLSYQNYIQQIESELDSEIIFVPKYPSTDLKITIENQKPTQIVLLENTRFYKEEKNNDSAFAKELSQDYDIFIFDAFGTAHRKHATTYGLSQHLPSTLGSLVVNEVKNLNLALEKPEKPLTLILGGAKIKTKIGIIETFLEKADFICIGGALANTFLYAAGYELGQSMIEQEETETAIKIINKAKNSKAEIILPIDLVTKSGKPKSAINFTKEDNALDIGPLSTSRIENIIKKSKTIIFNGPMGVFQKNKYTHGTESILKTIANQNSTSILGGGDTLDALTKYGLDPKKFTHVSTGGGAMLRFLEKGSLPVIEAISNSN